LSTPSNELNTEQLSTPNQTIIDPSIPDHAVPVDVVDQKYSLLVKRGYQQSYTGVNNQEAPVKTSMDLLTTMDHW
jgi:hypothetical protein